MDGSQLYRYRSSKCHGLYFRRPMLLGGEFRGGRATLLPLTAGVSGLPHQRSSSLRSCVMSWCDTSSRPAVPIRRRPAQHSQHRHQLTLCDDESLASCHGKPLPELATAAVVCSRLIRPLPGRLSLADRARALQARSFPRRTAGMETERHTHCSCAMQDHGVNANSFQWRVLTKVYSL
jgi:hypothetical protein